MKNQNESEVKEKTDPEEILEKIKVYIGDVQRIAVVIKGDSLQHNNMPAYTSAQATIDVALDIQSLLDGKTITSLVEFEKAVKKEEEGDPSDHPYNY